ncbi:MAG: metallophosphoesterase family protein [Candidatus Edwardsbacteria bacterium]|nr:metallophosphoesterase family protein [Candidatus Edwardsbacteria bacterium]
MRCALISDIHGNHEALAAVLADIKQKGIKDIFCLGDTVGYGADPAECLAEVGGLTDKVIAGNHDHGAVGLLDLSNFNLNARKAAEWTGKKLTSGERDLLKKLPLNLKSSIQGNEMLMVHSTPHKPEDWHYILSLDEAEYQFEKFGERLCFVGHSHQPVFWECDAQGKCSIAGREYVHLERDRRYIINVGSVGQPRDGDPRATYAICDGERMEVAIRRVEYDIKSAQGKIIRAGLPARLAERLSTGI